MALTDDQNALVRYYMGYSAAGVGTSLFPFHELAYSDVSYMGVSLDGSTDNPAGGKLNNLSAPEEARITGFFLPNLLARETEIQAAASNLDTDQASVWYRNRSEVSDRRAMFTALRLELCHFLGFPPGSGLRTSNRVVRA
jgi:hypothetical protein